MCRFSTWETSFECQKYYLYRSIYIFMCQFSICFIPPAHNRTNTCKQPTQMLMISIGKCLSIFKQTIRIFGEQRDIIWIQIYACFPFRLFLSLYLPRLLVLSSPFVSRRYAQRKYIFFWILSMWEHIKNTAALPIRP